MMRVCLAEHNDQPSTLSQPTLRTRLRGRSCTRPRTPRSSRYGWDTRTRIHTGLGARRHDIKEQALARVQLRNTGPADTRRIIVRAAHAAGRSSIGCISD